MKVLLFFSSDSEDKKRLEVIFKTKERSVEVINTAEYQGEVIPDIQSVFLLGSELLKDPGIVSLVNKSKIWFAPSFEEIKRGLIDKAKLMSAFVEFSESNFVEEIENYIRVLKKAEQQGWKLQTKDFLVPDDFSYDELKALLLMIRFLGAQNISITIGEK